MKENDPLLITSDEVYSHGFIDRFSFLSTENSAVFCSPRQIIICRLTFVIQRDKIKITDVILR